MATRRDQTALHQRRLKAARLFSKGFTQAEVARRLDVSRVSSMRWYQCWVRDGPEGLASSGPLGRPRRLSKEHWSEVEEHLRSGPRASGYTTDLWTLARVAELIERLTGERFHPGHVWRLLRGRGWTLQRPTTRARERDEERILEWTKRDWRRVKKTSADRGRSSSSTRRASVKGG